VKSLALLGSLFNINDQTGMDKPSEEPSLRKVQDIQKVNIGTQEKQNYLNLGSTCTEIETL